MGVEADSGLLNALLNVQNIEHLYNQPWVGYSWEGLVIEQIFACLGLFGLNAEPYFSAHLMGSRPTSCSTGPGNAGPSRSKLTSDPTKAMIKGLQKAAKLVGASKQIIICKTAEEIRSDSLLVTNLPSFLNELVQTKHQNHGAHAKPRR
jgi:hypothetical protein